MTTPLAVFHVSGWCPSRIYVRTICVICCSSHCQNTLTMSADIRSSPGAEVLAALLSSAPTSCALMCSNARPPSLGSYLPGGPWGKWALRIACLRSWRPSAIDQSSATNIWPALLMRGAVYTVAVHTSLPFASCRNRFEHSLFAFRIALRRFRLDSYTPNTGWPPSFRTHLPPELGQIFGSPPL